MTIQLQDGTCIVILSSHKSNLRSDGGWLETSLEHHWMRWQIKRPAATSVEAAISDAGGGGRRRRWRRLSVTPVEGGSGAAGRGGDDVGGTGGEMSAPPPVVVAAPTSPVEAAAMEEFVVLEMDVVCQRIHRMSRAAVIFISIILFALLINNDLFIKGIFVYLTLFSPTEHNRTLHSYC
ncbi:unnamed protein product [Cuscuta epithymum]|uniref:Uncharacterized protein n=1 Tax=Cuscuta epithymum TaxID=186058 RepID=A0AAV0D5M2_9ASTE|nr:unnamed protein product [Cuscuta epithymum]